MNDMNSTPNDEFFLPGMFMCSPSKKFTYIDMPKTGCTKVRQMLILLEWGEAHKDTLLSFFKDVPPGLYYHWELGMHDATELKSSSVKETIEKNRPAFSFTFVRHPYQRLYSAWKNKVRSPSQPYYRYLSQMLKRDSVWGRENNPYSRLEALYPHEVMYKSGRVFVPPADLSDVDWPGAIDRIWEARNRLDFDLEIFANDALSRQEEPISFPDFIKEICQLDRKDMDIHWLPMSDIVPEPGDFDFIGRYENFHEELARLLEGLDAPSWMYDLISERANATPGAYPEHSDETKQLIYDRYRKDFDLFGYNP